MDVRIQKGLKGHGCDKIEHLGIGFTLVSSVIVVVELV